MKTLFTKWRQLLYCSLILLTANIVHAQTKIFGTYTGGPTTYGGIYSLNPDGSNYKTEYGFAKNIYHEANPWSPLVAYNGKLYGTLATSFDESGPKYGAIFSYDPATKDYTVIYRFNDQINGKSPKYITLHDGKLYGICVEGGSNNVGTFFVIDPSQTGDSAFTKLSDFTADLRPSVLGPWDLAFNGSSVFFFSDQGGSFGQGTLFSYDLTKSGNSGLTKLVDFDGGANGGLNAYGGGITVYNGKIYGNTGGGGNSGFGTFFSFDPAKTDATGLTTLYDFDGGANGGYPAGLVVFNNKIYGMNYQGGSANNGNIFSFDPSKSGNDAINDAYDFQGGTDNGGQPVYLNNLFVYNNKLYGTTNTGGNLQNGMVFSYDPNTGGTGFTKLGDLTFADNYGNCLMVYNDHIYVTYTDDVPHTGHIDDISLSDLTVSTALNFADQLPDRTPGAITLANGKIYGLETGGMFKYDPDAKITTDLSKFNSSTGYNAVANLVSASGIVYGVTSTGGTGSNGTLYSYNTKSDKYSVLVNFSATNGYNVTQLILSDNKVFASTSAGGINGLGNIFSYDIAAGAYTKLYDFTSDQNGVSTGVLTLINGKLYGWGKPPVAFSSDQNAYLFSFDLSSKTYTKEYDASGASLNPTTNIAEKLLPFNGKLYGLFSTQSGGPTAFQFYTFDLTSKQFSVNPKPIDGSGNQISLSTLNNNVYGLVGSINSDFPNSDVFKYDPVSSNATTLYDFMTGATGRNAIDFVIYTPLQLQTITFKDIPAKNYGDADFVPGATSDNTTLPITYASDNTKVATITSDGKIHILSAGTANITASQAGNDSYADAPDVIKVLTVNKAPLTISAKDAVIVYGNPVPTTFEITYDKFMGTDTQAVLGGTVTATTTATATSPSGQYPINVTGPPTNANYAITYKPGKLTISDGTPVIIYGSNFPAQLTYGAQPFDPGATSSAGTPPVYTTSDANVAIVTSENKIKVIGAGSVTITATFEGGNSFDGGSAAKTLTIAPAALTVTANDATRRYKAADPVFAASYSGFVNGDNESSLATPPQFNTTATSTSLPNVYDIKVCCSVSPNYTFTYVKGKLTVTGNQDVTFNAFSAMTYGDAPFDPGANATSGITPTYTTDNPSVAVIEGNKIRITGAGTANITANFPSQGDYLASTATQKLTVQPHALTISADNQYKVQGQPNPVFTATYNGFVNGDTYNGPGVLTTQPSFSTTATTTSPVGNYPVTVTGAASNNYTINYVSGTLTVAAARSLTFNALPAKTYGEADFDAGVLSVTAETIQYTSSNPAVATITNGKVHIVGAGSTTLSATLPVNTNYPVPTLASQLLVVNPATLVVTVNNLSKIYLQPNPALTVNYQGFVNGDNSSSLATQPVAATIATTSSYPGTYSITVGGGSSNNYTLQYVSATLTITPATGADQNTMTAKVSSRSNLDVNIYLTTQQPVYLMLYDVGGRLLNSQQPPLYKGFNTYTFDVSRYPVGTYIVKAVANDLNVSQKILVH